MPINETGQGYSGNTPIKQEAFRYFMSVHAGIVRSICNSREWAHPDYYYIDTNAGTGKNHDQTDGSVLIARSVVRQAGLNLKGYAIEQRKDAARILQKHLSTDPVIQVVNANNADILHASLLPNKKWLFGLVYCDANDLTGFPLQAVIEFFHPTNIATERIDILIQLSATQLKRCRFTSFREYALPSIMQKVNKKHWYIREPTGNDQWIFLFGINWPLWPKLDLRVNGVLLKNYKSLGMHSVTTPEGQRIFEIVHLTNEEGQKKSAQMIFPTIPIGNISPIPNSGLSEMSS